MKTYSLPKMAAALFCFGIANFAIASNETDSVVTAVFSRSFNNYERPVRADGTDQPLTYVVARGGYAPGTYADDSIEDVKFAGIVRVLGNYLAKQGYYPAKEGKKADLMLLVHWGKTLPFSDDVTKNMMDEGLLKFETLQREQKLGVGHAPGIDYAREQRSRHETPESKALDEAATEEMVQGAYELRFSEDMRNDAIQHTANLLGYTAELKYRDNPSLYAGAGAAYYDLIGDLESPRYYVSVTAYDFQEALKHNHNKGLWRTVASIDARGNRFDERLITMVDKASRYFGRDSEHLIRQFQYTPHIDYGELKTLGVVDKEPPARR